MSDRGPRGGRAETRGLLGDLPTHVPQQFYDETARLDRYTWLERMTFQTFVDNRYVELYGYLQSYVTLIQAG